MQQTSHLGFGLLTQSIVEAGWDMSTVTIQRFDGTQISGTEDRGNDANWDNVSGLVALDCMAARDIFMTRVTQSKEVNSDAATDEENWHHVNLLSYVTGIEQGDRAVLTNGAVTVTLDIRGVEHDSQWTQTRLSLRSKVK